MLMDDDAIKNKARLVKNFEEKVREKKIVKICETRSRSQNSVMLITKTVMLMLLYVLLMILLITIRQMQLELVKFKCYGQLCNSPHVHVMDATVHEIHLKST